MFEIITVNSFFDKLKVSLPESADDFHKEFSPKMDQIQKWVEQKTGRRRKIKFQRYEFAKLVVWQEEDLREILWQLADTKGGKSKVSVASASNKILYIRAYFKKPDLEGMLQEGYTQEMLRVSKNYQRKYSSVIFVIED